jgi:sugar/nucleoside kinase (ribokinase family)
VPPGTITASYSSTETWPAALVTPGDIKRAASAFHGAGTVVIQLQQPPPTALAAAKLGRQCQCCVVLDGAPAEEYREPLLAISDVVRADAREAELLTGCSIRSGDDAIAAGREILQQGPTLAALAAGEDGNALVWPGGSVVIPLADGPVVDTTGAGDAFIAALVAALADGLSPAESGQQSRPLRPFGTSADGPAASPRGDTAMPMRRRSFGSAASAAAPPSAPQRPPTDQAVATTPRDHSDGRDRRQWR